MKKRDILLKFIIIVITICASISAIGSPYEAPAPSIIPNYRTLLKLKSGAASYDMPKVIESYSNRDQSKMWNTNPNNSISPYSGTIDSSVRISYLVESMPGSRTNATELSLENTGNHFGVSYGTDGSINMELAGATGAAGGDDLLNAIQTILRNYKNFGVAIVAVCIITAILSLLIQITKLGAAGDNEQMRLAALKGIIYSGAVIAVFGALTLVIGIIWNVLD